MASKPETITVQNVVRPGSARAVNAALYEAMRRAYLKVLPRRAPGLTVEEIARRVVAHLPETLYPGGARAGWWAKTVQLDLEARGVIAREKTRPLRLHKT